MGSIIGIVVCVNYDDILERTLPFAMKVLSQCRVVTSYEDESTQQICERHCSVQPFITNAFTADGAVFNKGRAIHELLYQQIRHMNDQWVLIFDADCAIPESFSVDVDLLDKNTLYGASRRMLTNFSQDVLNNEQSWGRLPLAGDVEFAGFFQLFNTSAECLKDRDVWYDPTFTHAGGGDAHFQSLFISKVRLPVEVLHIGERDRNWFGRVTARIDGKRISKESAVKRNAMMHMLKVFQGWRRGFRSHVSDRIKVPGVISDYIWGKSRPPE